MKTFDSLVDDFRAVGISTGDTVLVHSSYKSLGEVDGGPRTALDALMGAVGYYGTLILPTFNFDFCNGVPFNSLTTPSRMGIISELGRQHPWARRWIHPIYSCAVIGRMYQTPTYVGHTSYGRDSIFQELRDRDGLILVIGLEYNDSMTFFHHVEQLEEVNYREHKTFWGEVDGKYASAEMFVRKPGVVTQVNPMGYELERQGLVNKLGPLKLMNANQVYDATVKLITNEPGLLYERPD